MRYRRAWIWGSGAAMAIVGLVVLFLPGSQPTYEGMSLSTLFRRECTNGWDAISWDEMVYGTNSHRRRLDDRPADSPSPWRQLGSNAVPFLVRYTLRRENILQRGYRKLYPTLPAGIRGRLSAPIEPELRQGLAAQFLGQIALSLRDAPLEHRVRLFGRVRAELMTAEKVNNMMASQQVLALAQIGLEPEVTWDYLAEKLRDQKNTQSMRYCSAIALAVLDHDADGTAHALIDAFRTDPDRHVRSHALTALGYITGKTDKAAPILIEALSSTDKLVRIYAVLAFQKGAMKPSERRQALTEIERLAAEDPDPQVREQALSTLRKVELNRWEQVKAPAKASAQAKDP